MEDIEPHLIASGLALHESVESVETHLEALFSLPLEQHLASLSKIDRAKLEIAIAYALNTLSFIYLKTQGVSPKEHPVSKELERIKLYFQKIKDIQDKSKAKLKIDAKSASRFIKHSLSGNKDIQDSLRNEQDMSRREAERILEQVAHDIKQTGTPAGSGAGAVGNGAQPSAKKRKGTPQDSGSAMQSAAKSASQSAVDADADKQRSAKSKKNKKK
ncbi:uncharacterized protein BJ171DRAFT_486102 [Polychytrium aggregatum]|uniref:uncharacterized protein n=1 Tax=Polychytrium aggregatum TaxID=110093 RepID=UPI0022FE308D|nr:uncharacterized protein BJ171DRAFT_486102 [Polychytrium aggregatum]KAI9209307.1 hypothetical protein BJ171DRAFT_486102 [Polychytrium aggregatum]